jgi:pyrroloquinoline quinone biosynthesis protein D
VTASISSASKPHLPRGVRLRRDEARNVWLLLAPETIFELNGSSAEILKQCTGEKTLDEIVDDLSARFDVERSRLESETMALLDQLHGKRLLDL